MKAITNTEELYIEFLADIYNAEVLLVPELRIFLKKVTSDSLKKALKSHLSNTRLHVTHLEELQEDLNEDILEEHCRTMKSMIVETKELVDRCTNNELVELAIVASLRRITQWQITVYQMLISMADELALGEHKRLLEQCLNDKTNFDMELQAPVSVGTSR